MRILVLGNQNSGVSFHRSIMPIIYMMRNCPDDYVLITNSLNRTVLDQGFDIVMMSRCIEMPAVTMAHLREEFGFKLVVDNDDYWHLDPHHVLYDTYKQHGTAVKIEDYIRIADLCTCTHERLAEAIRTLNRNVHILPNALPYGDGQFADVKKDSDRIRLYWAGSDTHAQDVSILRGPMQRVFSDGTLREQIRTVMSGYTERSKPVWDVMISAFTCGLRLDTQIYNYSVPDKYMFAACDSDIHMIPLLDTRFNGMKSNLKVLEAAAKKNPAIVSYCNPYLDLPVCYAPTQKRWYQWIKELVNDEACRKEKGQELFYFCNKNFNLYEWNKVRYKIYKSLL